MSFKSLADWLGLRTAQPLININDVVKDVNSPDSLVSALRLAAARSGIAVLLIRLPSFDGHIISNGWYKGFRAANIVMDICASRDDSISDDCGCTEPPVFWKYHCPEKINEYLRERLGPGVNYVTGPSFVAYFITSIDLNDNLWLENAIGNRDYTNYVLNILDVNKTTISFRFDFGENAVYIDDRRFALRDYIATAAALFYLLISPAHISDTFVLNDKVDVGVIPIDERELANLIWDIEEMP